MVRFPLHFSIIHQSKAWLSTTDQVLFGNQSKVYFLFYTPDLTNGAIFRRVSLDPENFQRANFDEVLILPKKASGACSIKRN